MHRTLLSIGHGYSARAFAAALLPLGWQVIGTTRSADKAERIAATGVEPVLWPGTDLSELIATTPNILVSAGPGRDGDPTLNAYRDVFARAAPNIRWLAYLSTTGVYGDHEGGWVDETAPLDPATARGQARIDAEQQWQSIPDLPVQIFRLAGIYGPGRGPFEKLRNGTAQRIIKKNQVFSRVHVEDIASALALSLTGPRRRDVFNLCDDDPAPPQDVLAHAAKLLGLPIPPEVPFETADMSPMARSFYSDSKCVRNDHAKSVLGWQPKYPTYRSGLAALRALETSEPS